MATKHPSEYDPSSFIRADYAEYVRHFEVMQRRSDIPPWFDPLDFDTWLSRQPMRYLEGRGAPIHPVA